jgi:hypothetical protein
VVSFQDLFDGDEVMSVVGGPVADAFRSVAAAWENATGQRATDKVREDTFRNIVELITFRQNIFTIILAAQYLAPDGTSVIGEDRGVATVFRDAYTGTCTTNSLSPVQIHTSLSLLVPDTANEGIGILGGRVSIGQTCASPTSVSLASSVPERVSVPPVVVIPAGHANALFNLTVVDDAVFTGPQSVTVTADAAGFAVCTAAVVVLDNDFYTLSATASQHGTISPSGNVVVARDNTTNFVVVADPHYHIGRILRNSVPIVGPWFGKTYYQFVWIYINADASVSVRFDPNLTVGGTPEYWLAQHGLTNGDWEAEDAADRDGDGMTAGQEYLADTDPTNKASALRLTGFGESNGSNRVVWIGGTWATQWLDVTAAMWPTGGWWTLLTNQPPTAVQNEFEGQDGGEQQRFFRIRARR